LRSRFGHPPKRLTPSEHFIFARAAGQLVALRADRILEIISTPREALDLIPRSGRQRSEKSEESANSAAAAETVESFAGVCKLPQGLVFIFDLQNFLSRSESRSIQDFITRAAHVAGDKP